MQLSDAVRNAMLNAIEATIGASAKLQLRSGAAPANCAAAATGTLIAELALPADWMAAAAAGTVGKAGTWSGNGAAAGDVGHYRIVNTAGTVCGAQGPVGVSGSSTEMELVNVNVAVGQTVTISAFNIAAGNA